MLHSTQITIEPVIGGFIVSYPKMDVATGVYHQAREVTSTSNRALKIARAAVEANSLVSKPKNEPEEN